MYKEDKCRAEKYRDMLLEETENFIIKMREDSVKKREEFIKNKNQDELRAELKNMLGYPLCDYKKSEVVGNIELIDVDEYSEIYRVFVECLEGVHSYGLLFLPKNCEKSDLIIAMHGKEGTPEIASSFYDSCNYNDMVLRIRKRNTAVYIPQLLLWNERYGACPDNEKMDVDLKQLGGSNASLEAFKIMKTLDFIERNPRINGNFGAIGMSYGGFYTLLLTALDTRIRACMSSSFFNDRFIYNWNDWIWFNSGNKFLDSELCMLIFPRPLYIAIGENDPTFRAKNSLKYVEKVEEIYTNSGKFVFEKFDGEHEFTKNDSGIEFVINEVKHA
ncbi:MAG: hypothetical protein RR957_02305 [Oscillospiraceae bacterium]